MRPGRRAFLRELTAATAAVVAGFGSSRSFAQSFRGTRAGDEALVDGIRLCWCPAGRFVMGSPETERGRRPDEAQTPVTLTKGFWTAKHEVTQGEWKQVIGAFPDKLPSAEFGEGDDFPVYWISFDEAEKFCAALTQRAHRAGTLPSAWTFSIPTEAQWEYACRAGTTTATAFGDTLDPGRANFFAGPDSADRAVRARGRSRRIGSYAANPWGIHDMHGNVWEWCRDYYHSRLPGGSDPDLYGSKGAPNRDGTYSRVRRGGAWIEPEWACRSACRLRYESHRRSDHIGFRIVAIEG